MLNTIKCRILQMYGTEENEKKLRNNTLIVILMLCIMLPLIELELPTWVCIYFNCLGGVLIATLVSMYFFKKKRNCNNFKHIKIFIYLMCLIITLIIVLPAFAIIGTFNMFADITNKLYVIKRNPMCFIVEIIYHLGFALLLVQQTMLYSKSIVYLFVTYTVFLLADKLFCKLFRKMIITGKNKYYERYRYSNEMDIISEYVFLGATVASILCSTTEYSLVFIPIMLWYALKQMKKYRAERKNANYTNQYLNVVLQKLIEINDVFLETSLDEKIIIKEYINEDERLKYYMEYNSDKGLFYYFSKRKTQSALESINSIISMNYNVSKHNQQAKKDIEATMNNIVRCIS